MFIGEQRGQFLKSVLIQIPFFQACFLYNGDNRAIRIPDMKPVGLYISHDLIEQSITFRLHEELPVEPWTVALIMGVVDFFGNVWVVEEFAREYCIPSQFFLLVNSYRTQKSRIRDVFGGWSISLANFTGANVRFAKSLLILQHVCS